MTAWTVFRKELLDALRDRRTLLVVLLSSVAIGPIVLIALSALVAGIEQRAEERSIVVSGIEHAPTLRNYLERQTYRIATAPADYEHRLASQQLGEPVLVIGKGFETELARGEPPRLEVVSSSSNQRASQAVGRVARLLRGFSSEQSLLRLTWRGVAPAMLDVIEVQERDLANPQSRAAQFTGMLPFFILMAVLYGALNAALDTTAGERERGSLEPLLMTPASRGALVIGKWGAVAAVGMLIALLSCLSFLPAQGLLRSETLAAMFRFGVREVALFLALLAPLAAALAAAMMAIAIRCKTFKEAQANNTVVVLGVSLLPLLTLFNQSGEAPWHLWTPALGQVVLMNRVLKGEALTALDVVIPLAVSAAIAAACIVYVARQLRAAALR
jgi:sodium transport system permease protein